jgi:phosphate transport system protein
MVEVAIEMLRDAHHAFLHLDTKLANAVCRRDDEVDRLNRHVITEIAELMQRDPDHVSAYLHVFSASRIVERIGDHATNIAEDVIYLAHGAIARHHQRSA